MGDRSPWTCRETEKSFAESLEGTLSPREEERLQAHLTGCSRCRETFILARRFVEAGDAGSDLQPGSDYWQAFLPRLEKRIREVGPGRISRRNVWTGISLAAAAGILLSGGLAAWLVSARGRVGGLEDRLDRLLLASAGSGSVETVLEDLFPDHRLAAIPADALGASGEEIRILAESVRVFLDDLSGPDSTSLFDIRISLDPEDLHPFLEDLKNSPEFSPGSPKEKEGKT